MPADRTIRLNFFPLKDQTVSFIVWRQETTSDAKAEGGLNKFTMRMGSSSDEERPYLVSFDERPGFEPHPIKSTDDWRLVTRGLFHAFVDKVGECLPPEKFHVPSGSFRSKKISFVLSEGRLGKQTVWLEPYYLNATSEYGFLADFHFVKNNDIPFTREVQRLSLSLDANFRSNRDFYSDRFKQLSRFLSDFEKTLFPFSVTGGNSVEIITALKDLSTQKLEPRTFVFGGNKRAASQWSGLKEHGPLSLAPRDVCFVYVYRKQQRTLAEDLWRALAGKSYQSTFPGIEPLTRMKIQGYEKIEVERYDKPAIDSIIDSLEAKQREKGDQIRVLPVVISDKEDKETYYAMKAGLLKKGMPVQVVTPQLIGRKESLKWSVANIALQLFAKSGGTPWSVAPRNERCLIVGLGQSHRVTNRRVEKFFAYSVCTDSSGLYKRLAILGSSTDRAQYLTDLGTNIVAELNEATAGYKECILHVPFRIRKDELAAISAAVQKALAEQRLPKMRFTVLKVNTENKFFGYAHTNSLVPYEGNFVVLEEGGYLIWFDGLQPGREVVNRRISGPTHVTFWWSSDNLSEAERSGYLQDLINLAGTNWRGFNAKTIPISIYYCDLIAEFAKNCPDAVGDLATVESPWFL